jgi:hypothetical protein
LVAPDHEGLEVRARFAEPVGLHGARAIRKLLQTTGPTLALLDGMGPTARYERIGL